MTNFPSTRLELIAAIVDPLHREAWCAFVDVYQPALRRWLLRRGLPFVDAEDCVQQVFMAVSKSISTFESDGKPAAFRRWLLRIARNELVNHIRRQKRSKGRTINDSAWSTIEAISMHDETFAQSIEMEFSRSLFQLAATEVRGSVQPKTWEAFWRTLVLGEPTTLVASELGLSVGSIYVAKGRVLQKIQTIVDRLQSEINQ